MYCHSEEINSMLWRDPDALKEKVVVLNKEVFRVNLLWKKNNTDLWHLSKSNVN